MEVSLRRALPARLAIGQGNAFFVHGAVTTGDRRMLRVELDGGASAAESAALPDGEFWGVVDARPPARALRVGVVAERADGAHERAEIGAVELEDDLEAPPAESPADPGGDGPLVAIAMATHEPDPALFERQVASLREQTHRRWICVISDDASSPEAAGRVERAIAGDPRFALSRSQRRLGFYANFERALAMVPERASFVALADQDDRWHDDKLATLLAALGEAELVYSDARATKPDGSLVSESLWDGRRNNRTNLASLLISNTVTGATALFRRRLLERAMPFPAAPGEPYHDHWIALVALAAGEIAYVDRPLIDYAQHSAAVLGSDAIRARGGPGLAYRLRRLARSPGSALERWRDAYFEEYCRTLVFARVLELRFAARLSPPRRRALSRVLRAERSPAALAWLAVRPLRSLGGRNETRGFEHRILRGILWRRLAPWASGRSRSPDR